MYTLERCTLAGANDGRTGLLGGGIAIGGGFGAAGQDRTAPGSAGAGDCGARRRRGGRRLGMIRPSVASYTVRSPLLQARAWGRLAGRPVGRHRRVRPRLVDERLAFVAVHVRNSDSSGSPPRGRWRRCLPEGELRSCLLQHRRQLPLFLEGWLGAGGGGAAAGKERLACHQGIAHTRVV